MAIKDSRLPEFKAKVKRRIAPEDRSALHIRRSDPRNDRLSPKYDPSFAAETIAMYKRATGEA